MSPARRLENRDYSSPGLYFITACSNFKRCIFGRADGGAAKLNSLGRIADEAWNALPGQFPEVRLHGHVVMPNHVHGIIEILAQPAAPLQGNASRRPRRVHSLSEIVRTYKARVSRRAHLELKVSSEIWQHNYYDRVIRDSRELSNAARYIAENPVRWAARRSMNAEAASIKKAAQARHAAPLQGES